MEQMTRRVRLRKANVLIAIVLVVVAAAIVLAWPQPGGFRIWLAEVRDGDDDWGWDLLAAETQREYRNDPDAYLADVAAADWARLDLGPAVEMWADGGFVRVQAELRSDPTTVPAFLFDRRIVHGVCDSRQPIAIGVYEDRRPFQAGAFGGGGVTGSQRQCQGAFADNE